MNLKDAVQLTPPKVLLYGPAGTWKTTFSTTWGQETEILDLDKGLLSALKVQDSWTSQRHQVDVTPCYDVNPNSPTAFTSAKKRIFELSSLLSTKSYKKKLLVVDSLSALGDHAMRSILGNSGKIASLSQGKAIQVTQQEWGLAITEVKNVLTVLRSLPVAVVVVAHELTEQIDNTTRIKIWALGAKLPDELPTFFDEVWYSRVIGAGAERRAVLQTVGTSSVIARSRGCLPDLWETKKGIQETLKQIGYNPT